MDYDLTTGDLYFAGTTTATELLVFGASQSVFVAKHNCYNYNWIKVINASQVDSVEYLSAIGDSSQSLLLYATSSANPYIPLIYTISKTDGSVASAF